MSQTLPHNADAENTMENLLICKPIDEFSYDSQIVTELEKRYVDVQEAARIHNCSRISVYDLINRGRLRTQTVFGKLVVLRSDIEEFERQKPGPVSKINIE